MYVKGQKWKKIKRVENLAVLSLKPKFGPFMSSEVTNSIFKQSIFMCLLGDLWSTLSTTPYFIKSEQKDII